MGFASTPDINVVDPRNSFTGNLGPSASFVGQFVDVSDFTTVTFTAIADVPPAPTAAIQFEWSEAGTLVDSVTVFGSDASTNQTVHSTVRSKFFRVRYTANTGGSTNIRAQTLLRKGTISGGVSRVGTISGLPDAQVVNAVMFGKNPAGNLVVINETTTGNLIVEPPARSTTVFQITTAASLTSVQLDFAGLGAPTRRWMDIYNNTVRGNLFIRLGSAATLSNYHYKVPPQHVWNMPLSWPVYGGAGGTVFGIWDEADGEAHMTEGA